MIRSQLLGNLLMGLVLLALGLASQSRGAGGLGKSDKSDSKVKATATTTKPGADGKQTVTITLDINAGWHIYANPVDAEGFVNNRDFEKSNRTTVSITAADKLTADIIYPVGKLKVEGEYKAKIYQDRVTILAKVQRTMGDSSPLQVSINVNACDKNTCLPQGTVKLTIP